MTDLQPVPAQGLTVRRIQVVRLVAQGFQQKRIATRLGLAEFTVKSHIQRLLEVTGANSSAHMVAKCMAWDLISAEDVLGGES